MGLGINANGKKKSSSKLYHDHALRDSKDLFRLASSEVLNDPISTLSQILFHSSAVLSLQTLQGSRDQHHQHYTGAC